MEARRRVLVVGVLAATCACGAPRPSNQPPPAREVCAPVVRSVRPGPSPLHAPGITRIAVADLDGDGHQELFTVSDDVLAGTASLGESRWTNGRFGDTTEQRLAGRPVGLAVGDVTGDHIPDVVVAQGSAASVRVFPGNADGTLAPGVDHAAGANPDAVAIGDVTGDNVPDLVVAGADPENDVEILRGPDFHVTATVPLPREMYAVVIADVDHDGAPDIITGGVGVYALIASRGYQPTQVVGDGGVFSILVADVDRDGDLDLVMGGTVALGHGDGTFGALQPAVTGTSIDALSVGDVNADGMLDLVGVDNATSVEVSIGNGNGTFQDPVSHIVGTAPTDVAIADLDGDGLTDVVIATGRALTFMWGDHDGSLYSNHNDYQATPAGGQAVQIATGDYNEDGALDVAVAGLLTDPSGVLLGDGAGGLCPAPAAATSGPQYSIATGDLDGDGHLDLVVGEQAGIGVLLGHGTGMFAPEVMYGPDEMHPRSIVIADVNADRVPDVLVANWLTNAITVFLGVGDGTLQPGIDYAAPDPNFIAVADLTGDGIGDLISAGSTWQLLVGSGDGTFGGAIEFTPDATPHPTAGWFAVAELGGRNELVISGASGLSVYAYNGGTMTLQQQLPELAALSCAGPVVVADLDGDGRLDAAVACGDEVGVEHDLAGAHQVELYETGPGVEDVHAADLVHGAPPVILTANQGDGTITVLPLFRDSH